MCGKAIYGENMLNNYQQIKEYVMQLGNFTDDLKFDLQLKIIIKEVLAYCYRKDVPREMELPLADVIVSEMQKSSMFGGLDGNITSYREGDMSINYGSLMSNSQPLKYGGKLEAFKLIRGAFECSDKTNAQ